MKCRAHLGFLGVLMLHQLTAQPRFDAASVRPASANEPNQGFRGGPGSDDPGHIRYANVPLRQTLMGSFGVECYQLLAPRWIDTERYTIVATFPPETTLEQFHLMLQELLIARLNIKMHHENKEFSVYELGVAKSGSKLKASDLNVPEVPPQEAGTFLPRDGDGFPILVPGRSAMLMNTKGDGRTRISAVKGTMPKLARMLEAEVGRPVVDKTGLTGFYDFNVDFSTDGLPGYAGCGVLPAFPSVAGSGGGVSLFGAVEAQLGLKLESKKDPIDVLVIDSASKVPEEN